MIKRLLFSLFIFLVFTGSVIAQQYKVTAITGRVEIEVRHNEWRNLQLNETLDLYSVLRIGIGSSLTIQSLDRIIQIPAMQSGLLTDIIYNIDNNRIRISGQIVTSDTSAVRRTTGQVSTASARASDAANDLTLDEE